jgi:hypothetical protein
VGDFGRKSGLSGLGYVKAFTPSAIEPLRSFIRHVVNHQIDEVRSRGAMELVARPHPGGNDR